MRAKGRSARGMKIIVVLIGLLLFFVAVNWWMISSLHENTVHKHWFAHQKYSSVKKKGAVTFYQAKNAKSSSVSRLQNSSYERLLALAAHALTEKQSMREPKDLWSEPLASASAWTPCAHQRTWNPNAGSNGYILISANGGINQQRVAVCNAVAVARLLSCALVIPKFLYSSVWKDVSQFGDIYQEKHFMEYLSPDIRIVRELPEHLRSMDLEAIGSVITDADIAKEAKLNFYKKNVLPIIKRNRVVHFIGFGNRLAFDPIPIQLQRLRCRCNFHALRFVPNIQATGVLLLKRLRRNAPHFGHLDRYLLDPFTGPPKKTKKSSSMTASRYLALHLRFEIDMVAHSQCEFGGDKEETRELEAYREVHFPLLATHVRNTTSRTPPSKLRSEGLCPLTPEEAALMVAALGFSRRTHVFLAGSQIYGGKSRLAALGQLYPNLVTKEDLLTPSELNPFANFSAQLAALDFIGCAAADAFAMTDSGSQFSALVSGYRIYYGRGRMPTIRPNKRRLADILLKNATIGWRSFEERVRKAVQQTKRAKERPVGRSIYRLPRCMACMCHANWT